MLSAAHVSRRGAPILARSRLHLSSPGTSVPSNRELKCLFVLLNAFCLALSAGLDPMFPRCKARLLYAYAKAPKNTSVRPHFLAAVSPAAAQLKGRRASPALMPVQPDQSSRYGTRATKFIAVLCASSAYLLRSEL